jgi:peroxiredoxin
MKNIKMLGLTFSVAALIGVIVLSSRTGTLAENSTPMPTILTSAPAWQLQDLSGQTIHSTDYQGKVVILDFWATWCPPCRMEIPGFIDLQKKYQSQGLAVIGISVDQASPDSVKTFVQQIGINYPILQADDKVTAAYGGIEGLPTTIIIDRGGHIVKQYLGLTEKSEIEAAIKPLLKAKS